MSVSVNCSTAIKLSLLTSTRLFVFENTFHHSPECDEITGYKISDPRFVKGNSGVLESI